MDIYLSRTEPNFTGAKHIKDGIILQMLFLFCFWVKMAQKVKMYETVP